MNIAWACRTLGVSASGYYDWLAAQASPCERHRQDAELRKTIVEVHRQSRGTYGAPRVHAELRLGQGIRVGRKRVERLMRLEGLQGVTRRRRRGLTKRDAAAVPNDDLVARQFRPDGPNQLWVADITEHPTDQGRVYLAVVIDAWNRQVVGQSIADHLRAELVVDALGHGVLAATPRPRSDRPPQRPRHPIHVLGVRSAAPLCRPVGVDGHRRRRSRQRRGRELLCHLADRAARPPPLELTRAAGASDLRVDRGLLQPPADPLRYWFR